MNLFPMLPRGSKAVYAKKPIHMMRRPDLPVQRSGRPSLFRAGAGGRCSGSGFLEARSLGGWGIPWQVKQGTPPRIRRPRARNDGEVNPRQGWR